MTYTVLDIGAGSKGFAHKLSRCNPHARMLILCGEPSWGIVPLFRSISPERLATLILDPRPGIWRTTSLFSSFNVPNESLDLVTLNSPHPFDFMAMRNLPTELDRCLKPGGFFFSSYTAHDCGLCPDTFELVDEGRWRLWENARLARRHEYGCWVRDFPQSPVIASNIFEHRFRKPASRGSGYIYSQGISPGWKLWRKPN